MSHYAKRLKKAELATVAALDLFTKAEDDLRKASTEQLAVMNEIEDQIEALEALSNEARNAATRNSDRADRIRNLFL